MRDSHMTKEPKTNATATLRNIARITERALLVFIRSPIPRSTPSLPTAPWAILIRDIANAPPRSSNTMLTVVDVGIPIELNTSRRITSVTITARNTHITSKNVKYPGVNIPWRATSIIPLLMDAPTKTPTAATAIITRYRATLEPIAELMKLTASLLTPTVRSNTASTMRNNTINK